jgi:hypothetical protein
MTAISSFSSSPLKIDPLEKIGLSKGTRIHLFRSRPTLPYSRKSILDHLTGFFAQVAGHDYVSALGVSASAAPQAA